MSKETFQKAFDSISFSPDFQERTIDLLHQTSVKRARNNRKHSRVWKVAVAMALVAVVGTSAFAASTLMSPYELSHYFREPGKAALFERDGAISVEESQIMDEYIVTLHAIATGDPIYWGESQIPLSFGKTYIMLSFQRQDGEPMEIKFIENLRVSPVVDGYEVDWVYDEDVGEINPYIIPVNAAILGAGGTASVKDGVFYYLYETGNLDFFADHTVKLAVYRSDDSEGNPLYLLDGKVLKAENGTVSFREDITVPNVMFTLPLDKSKADPEKGREMLEERTREKREQLEPWWELYGWQSAWKRENEGR